jgi:putative N-acetylmannosamine-6-phosphate epimerase
MVEQVGIPCHVIHDVQDGDEIGGDFLRKFTHRGIQQLQQNPDVPVVCLQHRDYPGHDYLDSASADCIRVQANPSEARRAPM